MNSESGIELANGKRITEGDLALQVNYYLCQGWDCDELSQKLGLSEKQHHQVLIPMVIKWKQEFKTDFSDDILKQHLFESTIKQEKKLNKHQDYMQGVIEKLMPRLEMIYLKDAEELTPSELSFMKYAGETICSLTAQQKETFKIPSTMWESLSKSIGLKNRHKEEDEKFNPIKQVILDKETVKTKVTLNDYSA